MTYDENSFMLGLSVGKTMKGASYTEKTARDTFDTNRRVPLPIVVPAPACEFRACVVVPHPLVCSFVEV